MRNFRTIFKRVETKYLLNEEQYRNIKSFLKDFVEPDEYCESTICNLYFDTSDFELIRRSIQSPVYKEKLRLRSYCVPDADTTSFIEIKKKFKGVVYKRRISAEYDDAIAYLINGRDSIIHGQITDEIDWFMNYYHGLAPQMFIGYQREAFRGKEDRDFRVTFDYDVTWRDYDLDLTKGYYGDKLLENGQFLMEVKFVDALPLWLSHELDSLSIFKTSFSKYGNAYTTMITQRKNKGEIICA